MALNFWRERRGPTEVGASWVVNKMGKDFKVRWKGHPGKDSWEVPSSFVDFLKEDLVEYTTDNKIVIALEDFLKI